MRTDERDSIARQLADLGAEIQRIEASDTEKILDTAFKSVARLMNIAVKLDQNAQQMTEDTLSSRMKAYRSLMDKVQSFSAEVAKRPLSGEQQKQINTLNEQIATTQSNMDSAKALKDKLESEYRGATVAYEIHKGNVEKLEENLRSLRKDEEALSEREQACSPAILAQLRKEITERTKELSDAERLYDELLADLADLLVDIADTELGCRGVQTQIDSQSPDLIKRQKEYETLTTRLTQIINAEEECSDKKQQEIQENIDKEKPKLTKLEAEKKVLDEKLVQIQESIARLNEENNQRKIEIMPSLRDAIEQIGQAAGALEGELLKVKERADLFQTNIDSCHKLYDQYYEWYDSIETPITVLIEQIRKVGVVSETENVQLLQSLNPDGCETVHNLLEGTRKNLQDLDIILGRVIHATDADQRDTRNRADRIQRT